MTHQIAQENIIQPTRIGRGFWTWCIILSGVFIFCYAEVFSILVETWRNNTVYSHGFLVPLISLYLIWIRRHKLEHIQPSPGYLLGLSISAIGLSMLLTGHAGGILLLQELSLMITIIGIVILVLGIQFLKALWFPITYLVFMLTVWGTVIAGLHLPFQNFSATMGTKLLQSIGIPAYRESIYIELPNITLEVAKVCSGVNYLIAVAALGVPLAYIALKSWPRRVVLVSGGLLIAILANGLRVALIGTLSYYNMAGDMHGPYHVLQAMFVSVIGFIALFAGAWVLSEGSSSAPISATAPSAFYPPPQAIPRSHRIKYPLFLTVGILFLLGGYINFYHPASTPLKIDIESFPYEIGRWRGVESESKYGVFRTLGVDHELARTYRTTDGGEARLYIGYYEQQKQGKELVNYRSKDLHVGASKVKIILNPDESIEVNRVMKRERRNNRLVFFWYDLNGRVVTDRYKAKAYTTWDALIRGRTNGALVIVAIDIQNIEELKKTEHNAEMFLQDLLPVLHNYLS
jgi:EpsI family protein